MSGLRGSFLTQIIAVPPDLAISPKGRESDVDYKLLQATAYARDGRHRIPTPDRTAIMALSLSRTKRKLGKHQQLLTDIALRCREQEVYDLSSGITQKVSLGKGSTTAQQQQLQQQQQHLQQQQRQQQQQRRETSAGVRSPSVEQKVAENDANNAESYRTEGSSKLERNDAMFPQRKVLRSPPRKEVPLLVMSASGLPRLDVAQREGMITRLDPACLNTSPAGLLYQQRFVGQVRRRSDHLAPLVLPSIRCCGIESGNMSAYIQARRISISVTPRSGRAKIRMTARR